MLVIEDHFLNEKKTSRIEIELRMLVLEALFSK